MGVDSVCFSIVYVCLVKLQTTLGLIRMLAASLTWTMVVLGRIMQPLLTYAGKVSHKH